MVQILLLAALFLVTLCISSASELCGSFSSHNAYFDLNLGNSRDIQLSSTLSIN